MKRIVRVVSPESFQKTVGNVCGTYLEVPIPKGLPVSAPFTYSMGSNLIRVLCTLDHLKEKKVILNKETDILEADSDILYQVFKDVYL